jgi:UDP-N-acetylglucosamine transferase subunit ALG13
MVQIIAFEKKENSRTKESYSVLVLQGDPEVLISKTSKRPYIACRKTTIPCALEENQAQALIGKELRGSIERVSCTPFEVKLATGKKAKISSVYQFLPAETVNEKEVAQ